MSIADAVLMETAFNPGGCALMAMCITRGDQSPVKDNPRDGRNGGGVAGQRVKEGFGEDAGRLLTPPPVVLLPAAGFADAWPDDADAGGGESEYHGVCIGKVDSMAGFAECGL